MLGIDKEQSSVFDALSGYYARTLSQIRLGLSPLRGQLFTFNITENPICPLCLDAFESDFHFFLECPVLEAKRINYMSELKLLVPNLQVLSKKELLALCLSGVKTLNSNTNIILLKQSINFVKISNRFTKEHLA